MPQLQPLSHFTPDKPNGGRQSLHGAQRLVFITLHSDENLRRAGIFCQCDLAHAYQPDPRIGLVSVSQVALAEDARSAQVFVAVEGDEDETLRTMQGLTAAVGFIRREV